jgi:hypothetical protein
MKVSNGLDARQQVDTVHFSVKSEFARKRTNPKCTRLAP